MHSSKKSSVPKMKHRELKAAIITMETAVHRRLQEIHDAIHEVETALSAIRKIIVQHAGRKKLLQELLPALATLQFNLKSACSVSTLPSEIAAGVFESGTRCTGALLNAPSLPSLQIGDLWQSFHTCLSSLPSVDVSVRVPKIVIGSV